ncbi:hypothetical protein CDAR_18781 [Caerostris darwini]|uniref:Uncharacterized protein n=1 Tax=Caerostris darwini TaxID=1538125 RepID=A0AAV4WBK3_9ARAC|nr:hypothetical protein CDAR_18781 [Caerostris darwini]
MKFSAKPIVQPHISLTIPADYTTPAPVLFNPPDFKRNSFQPLTAGVILLLLPPHPNPTPPSLRPPFTHFGSRFLIELSLMPTKLRALVHFREP